MVELRSMSIVLLCSILHSVLRNFVLASSIFIYTGLTPLLSLLVCSWPMPIRVEHTMRSSLLRLQAANDNPESLPG